MNADSSCPANQSQANVKMIRALASLRDDDDMHRTSKHPMSKSVISAGCAILIASLATHLQADVVPDHQQGVTVNLQQMVPMRDGIHLAATVWRPAEQSHPLPAVLQLTPYLTDETHDRAVKFARAGYVFVSVDVRGRGDSEGVFRPQYDDGKDGAEVVEWIAQRPWCDGRIVMIGGSYRGMLQWRVLAQHPKHLAAIVPAAPPYPGYDEPPTKGIFGSYMVQWLAYVSGRSHHDTLFKDHNYWESHFGRNYQVGAPFASLGELAGSNQAIWNEWLKHHAYDSYWASYNPNPKNYAGTNIPVLTITGYFDGDEPGTLRYYREFSSNVSDSERAQLYILIGPWDHSGTRYPQKSLGGLTFPDNSVLDIDQLQIDWFNWLLKGANRPDIITDRVNYYAMEEKSGEWRHAKSLESITDHTLRFYLSSVDSAADDVFHSGRLIKEVPKDSHPDSFPSDPHEHRAAPGVGVWGDKHFLVDQRAAFGRNVLVYQTSPFAAQTTVAGFMRLTLNVSLDTPDADIYAEIQAVYPDGHVIIIGYDFVRARFRKGLEKEVLATPGIIEPYVFDGFYITDWVLPAGTRIRLVLSPLDTPDWERNDDTGGPLGVQSVMAGRVATITVHLDAQHPSYLELPVAKE
jgi:uncharacterized protein